MTIDIDRTEKKFEKYLRKFSKFLLNRFLTLIVGIIIFICSILLLVCFWFLTRSKEIENFIEQELGMNIEFPNIINYFTNIFDEFKKTTFSMFEKIYPKKKILSYIKSMLYLDEDEENKKNIIDLTKESNTDNDDKEWLEAYSLDESIHDTKISPKKIKLEITTLEPETKSYNSSSEDEAIEDDAIEDKCTPIKRNISISPKTTEKSVYEHDKSNENLVEENSKGWFEGLYKDNNKKND